MKPDRTANVRRMTNFAPVTVEQSYWDHGQLVVGIDEVGRGALAGPVSVGAVVLALNTPIDGVHDSKMLSPATRARLSDQIFAHAAAVAIGDASADEVDMLGLTGALRLAGERALELLTLPYVAVLLDGRHNFLQAKTPTTMIEKGDQRSQSIAAASIVAKVHRDRLMVDAARAFPRYGFADHKGYGSKAHRDAIATFGVCPLHRRTFAPCMPGAQLSLLATDPPQ